MSDRCHECDDPAPEFVVSLRAMDGELFGEKPVCRGCAKKGWSVSHWRRTTN